ncbi:MAG: anti-sigma factor antagonist [Leptolyngbya sp.]|nr:anti-sigma factor antagonist [Leptolyngbya sp.]
MSFNATTQIDNAIATITLTGDLDASSAPAFREQIDIAAQSNPQRIVLLASGLDYMASAGLRVLVFANQKLGTDVDIYLVAPQELVLETLQKTGFDQSVIIVDDIAAAMA